MKKAQQALLIILTVKSLPYLTHYQALERGAMKLHVEEYQNTYMRGIAKVGILWVEDTKAVRRGQQENRAAAAFVGSDLRSVSFIPNRDSIFVSTSRGTFVVPFKEEALK